MVKPFLPALRAIRPPSGAAPGLSFGPTIYVPLAVPGLTPAGIVLVLTKGRAIPAMITTPGGATLGTRPDPARPEHAANSSTSLELPATPTPPAGSPCLNNGTPTPFMPDGSDLERLTLPW